MQSLHINKMEYEMTPEELKQIVDAWGGVEKLARVLDVSNRTVSYWLAGRHKIKPPIATLIRSLKPTGSGSNASKKGRVAS